MKNKIKSIALYIISAIILCSCSVSTDNNIAAESTDLVNNSYPVHYDISIGYWDIDNAVGTYDELLRAIEDKFNISISPVSVSWGDYLERYLIMASTGKLPNVFSANVTRSSTYWDWAKQGIIRALPQNLEQHGNVVKALSLDEAKLLEIDGKYYCIPRTAFADEDLSYSDVGLLIRRDWMEALGIENPQNFEEFSEMLTRFALEDPDGNGVDDTSGLSVNNRYALGKWVILTLHADFNTYSWVKRDGEYIPSFMTEDFLDIITALDYMYETKALDQDFAIQRVNEATSKFAKGELGALEYKSSPSAVSTVKELWNEYQPGKDFDECVDLLPVFPSLDGNTYRNVSISYWSESLISSSVDDGKMERILSLYDYLMSAEGTQLAKYGIEGKDFNNTGDGVKITRTKNSEGDGYMPLDEIYPSASYLSTLASWGVSKQDFLPNESNNFVYGEDVATMCYDYMEWTFNNTVVMDRPVEFMTLASMGNNEFTSDRVIDDITRVILSSDDAMAAWQNIVAGYEDEGINEMIADMNELAKKYDIK